ncbi:MAG TPA: TaqI-like C-terminal specificity domain-containing protein, partial [Xanthobacteraceae bacterium]|nr:TaqI-like C-terminal specificity domain-containing protein [Xanthobacteraceae bacterium]
RKTLGEVYGAPLYGIKTGLNEAFIVDQQTRDRLVKQDKKSAKLLKPFLRGENIKRWRVEPEGLFLINIPKGKIDIEDFPAIRDWLKPFKKELQERATPQEWFELQQAQLAYQPTFGKPKIVYQDITADNPFALDEQRFYLANTCYFIPSDDKVLLSFLNSRLAWFFFSSITNIARGGYLRLRTEFVQQTPLPDTSKKARSQLVRLAQACTDSASHRLDLQSKVRHRILDLAPPERKKLSRKLEDWWTLDFAAFREEVKRVFKNDIPVKERGEWERYLAKNAAAVKKLDAEIEKAEREIDAIVYRLFDLTPEEISLLEQSIAGQY